MSTIPQHTWVSKLFGYDFTVEFKPERMNAAADALSRRDEENVKLAACAISRPDIVLFEDFRREAEGLQEIIAKCQEIFKATPTRLGPSSTASSCIGGACSFRPPPTCGLRS